MTFNCFRMRSIENIKNSYSEYENKQYLYCYYIEFVTIQYNYCSIKYIKQGDK